MSNPREYLGKGGLAALVKNIKTMMSGQGQRPMSKIYGVSGMGSVTPVWKRTYDAAGVTLSLNPQDGDLVNFVLSDNAMQDFFNFQETTDENGNVFIVIPPMSFRYDRINEDEVEALSVKLYEDGDEAYGYELHPAFKKWTSNTEFDGYGNIQIAKYMSAPLDTRTGEAAEDWISAEDADYIKVRSVAGENYALSYAEWGIGLPIIKATDPTYRMLHWSYRDLLVKLATIFFARSDIYDMLGATSEDSYEPTTGSTDEISSHSGFNRTTGQIKLFGIDAAFAATNINGIYKNSDDNVCYTHMLDTDAKKDGGYITSDLVATSAYGGEIHSGSITKISTDKQERALGFPTAFIQLEDGESSDPGNHSTYYCSRVRDWGTPTDRGQIWAFNKAVNLDGILLVEDGLFFVYWFDAFFNAWNLGYNNHGALRLCKEPS